MVDGGKEEFLKGFNFKYIIFILNGIKICG